MTPEPNETADPKSKPSSDETERSTDRTEQGQPADPTLTPGDENRLPGGSVQTGQPETMKSTDEFDWRGWLLVTVVFISFVVVPLFILYIPEAHWFISAIGFSQRQAFIVFPMIPAILLGLVAVWAAVTSQSPSS